MTSFVNSETLALLTGGIAFLTLVSSPLMRSRNSILVLQLCATIFFALHYACIGVMAACAVNMICTIQTVAAILAPESRKLNAIGWALIPVILATAIVFWVGPVSILSSLATIALAVGRMQTDEYKLRILIIVGGAFWIAHDYLVESWIALSADILTLTMGVGMLVSMMLAEQQKPNSAVIYAG